MKKIILPILIFLFAVSININTANAGQTEWSYYARPTATMLRNITNGLNTIVVGLIPTVSLYNRFITSTPSNYEVTVGAYTYRLAKGTFAIGTGIANTKTYTYCFSVQNAAKTEKYLLFYFDDINDPYGITGNDGCLAVYSGGHYYNDSAWLNYSMEVQGTNDGTNKVMRISIVRNNVSNITVKARVELINYSTYLTVGAHFHYNITSPSVYSGYHTLAYIVNKTSGYPSTALIGAINTAELSANGNHYNGGTVDHNYGFFSISGGIGTYIGQGATAPSGYPTTAECYAVYTDMTGKTTFFYTPSNDVNSLTALDLNAAGYDFDPNI